MSSTTALVTGARGQDGSYLCELLRGEGYHVIGTCRPLPPDRQADGADASLVPWNVLDQAAMASLLRAYRPREVYNLAALSSGAGMYDDAAKIGEVNGLAVTRILDAIREVDPGIRFCQASSSEMFGEPQIAPQDEATPFCPRSPYGAAKLYAHSMVRIYRQRYGLFACSAILFNHESPRRGTQFVTRKITQTAARIKLGLADRLEVGSLEARRDWGHAGDVVRAMWLMLQHTEPRDYVIATGETHSVRDVCEIAFGHLGLDYRNFVQQTMQDFRPPEAVPLVGNPERASVELGWRPTVSFRQLISQMVEADLQRLSADPPVTKP